LGIIGQSIKAAGIATLLKSRYIYTFKKGLVVGCHPQRILPLGRNRPSFKRSPEATQAQPLKA
jgi:hypothetical protein